VRTSRAAVGRDVDGPVGVLAVRSAGGGPGATVAAVTSTAAAEPAEGETGAAPQTGQTGTGRVVWVGSGPGVCHWWPRGQVRGADMGQPPGHRRRELRAIVAPGGRRSRHWRGGTAKSSC